jgi:hypothetical protein
VQKKTGRQRQDARALEFEARLPDGIFSNQTSQ